jgi:hypothetical protein
VTSSFLVYFWSKHWLPKLSNQQQMRRPTHTGARSSLFGAPEPSRGTSTQNDSHYGGAQMFAEQSEDTMEQDIFESTNQLRQGVSYIKDVRKIRLISQHKDFYRYR